MNKIKREVSLLSRAVVRPHLTHDPLTPPFSPPPSLTFFTVNRPSSALGRSTLYQSTHLHLAYHILALCFESNGRDSIVALFVFPSFMFLPSALRADHITIHSRPAIALLQDC